MQNERHVVVIGGTAAGLSAASKAKRNLPDLKITVFERSGFVSYGACGLPYFVGDMIKEANDLVTFTADDLINKRGIDTYIKYEVTKIDRLNKTVTAKDLITREIKEVSYTELVIATGASPFVPAIEGINLDGVHYLRTVENGIEIKRRIQNNSVKNAVIIGGGFIGLEMAEELKLSGLNVTLIEAMPRLLPFLNKDFSDSVKDTLIKNGVNVELSTTVTEICGCNNKVTSVRTKDEKEFKADIVIMSIGVKPNSELAKDAGLDIGYKGGIVVNEYMQTSDKDIYACGDCVQMFNLLTKEPTYVPLGTTANKQGKIAGSNLSGEKESFKGVLGSGVTKVFDLYIASTGLTEEQAKKAGYKVATTKITKGDRASYYPGSEDNHLYLVFDGETGVILGAQAIGSFSVAGRINVFVAAITAGMTVPQINELDLVYSPSVAPVYDPILIATAQAIKKVKR